MGELNLFTVNDTLFYVVPHVQQILLLLIDILNTGLVDMLLGEAPDSVVHC